MNRLRDVLQKSSKVVNIDEQPIVIELVMPVVEGHTLHNDYYNTDLAVWSEGSDLNYIE